MYNNNMITCIIFTKDRACQLELLLRTLKIRVDTSDINFKIIIDNCSDNDFENGYKRLIERTSIPNLSWIHRKDRPFKDIILEHAHEECLMFLVDDVCFVEDFSTKSQEFQTFFRNGRILTLSLRLSPAITYCYAYGAKADQPKLNNNIWEWKGGQGDWGVPTSIDGNIFKTRDIIEGLKTIKFLNPNELEGYLDIYAKTKLIEIPYALCFPKQKLVNFPLNKVQTFLNNKSQNISPKMLNENYLAGKRLVLDKILQDINLNMCHVEVKNITWEYEN